MRSWSSLGLFVALTVYGPCAADGYLQPIINRALPLQRASKSFVCSRSTVTCGERDDFVLYGDSAVLLGYGLVQGIVDVSFAPLQDKWSPELFNLLVGAPVMLPTLQVTVMTALWVAAGLVLSSIDSVNPFDIKKTRGVEPVAAALAAFAPWAATFVIMALALGGLDVAFQLGPGRTLLRTQTQVGMRALIIPACESRVCRST